MDTTLKDHGKGEKDCLGLPQICGKRRLLAGTVDSVTLYGAPTWCGALLMGRYANMIEKMQCQILLRVPNETVSTTALQVITTATLAEEKRMLFATEEEITTNHRKEVCRATLRNWENPTRMAQWTKLIIPEVESWVECKDTETDYLIS